MSNESILNQILPKLFQYANEAVIIVDWEQRILSFNRGAQRSFGYRQEEVIGTLLDRLVPQAVRPVHHRRMREFIESDEDIRGAEHRREIQLMRKDGSVFRSLAAVVKFPTDRGIYVALLLSDMTENLQVEAELRKSRASLAEAQRIAHMGSWDWDIIANTLHWSDEIYRIFGLEPQEFGATYETFLNSVHPDDRAFVTQAVQDAVEEDVPYAIDHRIVLPDGAQRVVHERGEVYRDERGSAVRMIGTVQDVTEQRAVEANLKVLSMAIEESINILFITDTAGRIEYVNPMFEQVTGYSREEAVGQTPRIIASGETPKEQYAKLWKNILNGRTWRGTFRNRKRNGDLYWVSGLISPIQNDEGKITHFLAIQEDVTEKMEATERARYLTAHDRVTGLLNRNRFMELTDGALSFAGTGAFLLIDLDGLRAINENYGHSTGDLLLKRIGELIHAQLRDFASEAKLGGVEPPGRLGEDEFALFIPGVSDLNALTFAERVRRAISEFRLEGPQLIRATATLGVALFPEHASTVDELLKRADAALIRAKELGRNRYHLYRLEDRELENIHLRLKNRERIITALDEDRFEAWYQPVLNLRTNEVGYYEVLMRLRENGVPMPPLEIIKAAENFGLIDSIDRSMFSKTLEVIAAHPHNPPTFSINISGKNLGDESFLYFLADAFQSNPQLARSIIFEITETAAIDDINEAMRFMAPLKVLGCRFALDDFGVGFTSFTYLKELPVDVIKIDGSFIRNITKRQDDRAIVRALCDIAHALSIKTVAEFVEDSQTLEVIRSLGIDYAQGYYIGRPDARRMGASPESVAVSGFAPGT